MLEQKSEMRAIKVNDISPNQIVGFDIYIYFPVNNKYIKYISSEDGVDVWQIQRLKYRQINQLFIRSDDVDKYRQFLSQSIHAKLNVADEAKRQEVIRQVAGQLLASIDTLTGDENGNAWINNAVELTKKIVTDFGNTQITSAFARLQAFLSVNPSLVNHALGVSALGVFLGMGLGLHDANNLTELAFGGLVHDIGMARTSEDILHKYFANQPFSDEELAIFKRHPQEGVKILGNVGQSKVLSERVLAIVLEHHENAMGTGFPRGLTNFKKSYLAKIISIADRLTLEIQDSQHVDIKYSLLKLNKEQATDKLYDGFMLSQLLKVF